MALMLRKRFLGALLALLAIGSPSPMLAQPRFPAGSTLAGDRSQSIAAVGVALHEDGNLVTTALQSFGFPPADANSTWAGWANWPIQRQIELAYRSAEVNGDGQMFLRQLVRTLGGKIDALRDVPRLADYFDEPRQTPLVRETARVRFGRLVATEAAKPLPPSVRQIIDRVVEHTGHLSHAYLMGSCCSLTADEAHRIQIESSSEADALERAMRFHAPPPDVMEKGRRLAQAAIAENPALAHKPEIVRLLDRITPAKVSPKDAAFLPSANANYPAPPTTISGPEPGSSLDAPPPMGGGEGSPGYNFNPENLRAAEASRYRNFEARSYRAPGARSFRSMVVRSGGFGGVIFGNSVTADPGLGKPVAVDFVPDAELVAGRTSPDLPELWGRLRFRMADGEMLRSRSLRADTVLAAKRLAWQHRDPDDGVGLVGLRAHFATGGQPDTTGFSYYVNPELLDTRLGRSMMLLDTLPQEPDILMRLLDEAQLPAADRAAMETIRNTFLGQYKIVDVPLVVGRTPGDLVTVERKADPGHRVMALRREAFITMNSFCSDRRIERILDDTCRDLPATQGELARPETALPFYQTVPALVAALEPFDRANEFAETFALMRWAVAQGATWDGPEVGAAPLPPMTAVLERDGIFQFAPSREVVLMQVLEERFAEAARAAKERATDGLAARTDQLEQLQRELFEVQTDLIDSDDPLSLLEARLAAYPEPSARAKLEDASHAEMVSIIPALKPKFDLDERERSLTRRIVELVAEPVCRSQGADRQTADGRANSTLPVCSTEQAAAGELWINAQLNVSIPLGYHDDLEERLESEDHVRNGATDLQMNDRHTSGTDNSTSND